ncbi:efflux transporter periplasmic adaptor subunit [Geothermobacter hydrogeniphilus]|uniref:Efflux transporter periplasmic adaptor subunit n=1 Tax=Geothermobacter hydrogeniphilus TaxID=1969733 RepID=A0A2K2HDF4_9BACT|nr:efflux RND transporter periplasmic adaptor subunit [Geothermobacter hydrogeniphilus]PNU21314.1 efflux transporter periplasmic adaptor subunit [Geothermobacter hydrogeniphilus]
MNRTNRKRTWITWTILTLAAVILAVGGTAFYFLNLTQPSSEPSASRQGQKVLYWRSPMNPTETYPAPGKDRMGMDLVPVYEGAKASGPPGTITIDPATRQNIGVKTVTLVRKRLNKNIRTIGRVAYDETRVRRITPKIGGWVERQEVNFTGQVVEKGQQLLTIYSPDLVSSQEEYLVALQYQRRLQQSPVSGISAGADSLLRATEARLRYWDISEAQIRTLRERGEITRTMALHAPFKGIIVRKNVPEGGYVKPGQNLYEIADISSIWVYADIYEYETPWLKLGQEAEITLAYQPGKTYRGKIIYIYPYLKNMTRTLQVRISFPNSDDFDLKPDMWANVSIKVDINRQGLAVPVQAVIRTGVRDIALVALDGDRFAPREIKLGAQVGDEFEVLKGLQEGDRVVTSAQFLINSESSLQAAIDKMRQTSPAVAPTTGEQQQTMPGMKMPAMKKNGGGMSKKMNNPDAMTMPAPHPKE